MYEITNLMGSSILIKRRAMLGLILPLCFALASMFATTARASTPFLLDRSLEKAGLSRYLEYFIDESGRLSIDDVSAPSFSNNFIQNEKSYLGFGYTRAAVWVRFSVKNTMGEPMPWLLEFAYAIIDRLELYVPESGGFRWVNTGDHLPFKERAYEYRTFIFPMEGKPGLQSYYLRMSTSGTLTVPLIAWSPKHFQHVSVKELLILGAYYGVMMALALYLLFIYFSIRERSYLYLALLSAGISFFTLLHNGLAFQYLWPGHPWWTNVSHPMAAILSAFFSLAFTRTFLSTRTRMPVADVMIRVLMACAAAGTLVPFFIDYYYATQFSVAVAFTTISLMVVCGLYALFQRQREGVFFMLASLSFVFGVLLITLMAYGLFPETFITAWGIQVGSAMMVLLFALGIADRINTMRRDRKKAIDSLYESEEKYRTLVENAHDGIIMLFNERPSYANASFMRMLGYSSEELYGKTLGDLCAEGPLGRELIVSYYRDRIAGREVPPQYEAQLATKNGSVIDVILSSSRISIGGLVGSITIVTDISQIKRAERTILQQYREIRSQYDELEVINEELTQTHNELRDLYDSIEKEKEQLDTTLRSIGDAVIATDAQGRITLINSAAESLTGWGFAEAMGKKISLVLDLRDAKTGDRIADPVEVSLKSGGREGPAVPLQIVRRDGVERMVELRGSDIHSGPEKAGAVLAIRDVTERIKTEQEMLKVSKIESLGVLAGGIAHDFNNLLTAILGNLSLAKIHIQQDSESIDIITQIERAAQRAVSLTRQLLTFSRGGEPVKKTSSIVDLVRESAEFLLSGSNVKCVYDLHEGVWPVEIDTDQISQVLQNVIINSLQAMPGGGILTIRAENVERPSGLPLGDRSCVRISIEDTGVGIPAENLDKVFDPYFTTKEHGSGLGLASSYSIIKRHGGYIDVRSRVGEGTSFHIYLLASDRACEKDAPPQGRVLKRAGRILVIDDEDYILETASKLLQHLGYEVSCARGEEDAITLYREAIESGKPFDAVIMDLTIPGGMGGRELLKSIREIDPDVAAVVSSGYSDDPVLANYREYGFRGVIAKPYELKDMVRVLDELFTMKDRGAPCRDG